MASPVQSSELGLSVDRVLAAEGADPAVIRRRNPALVRAAERALDEGLGLLAPSVARRTFAVTACRGDGVHLAGGGRLRGAPAAHFLSGAEEVVVSVCTIGAAVERRVSATLERDAVLGLAFDGFGTAAADALSTAVCGQVAAEAAARGWRATLPFSPGMMGWSLADGQDDVFSLVDAEAIGVTLTPGHLMVPRKSTSMVIGIGPAVEAGGRTCDVCNMRDTCRYRTRTEAHGG